MHVFELIFLHFYDNRAELSSLPNPLEKCGPAREQSEIMLHKNHTPEDEKDGIGEI